MCPVRSVTYVLGRSLHGADARLSLADGLSVLFAALRISPVGSDARKTKSFPFTLFKVGISPAAHPAILFQ
jgi:hypothetical protein